MKRVFVDSSAWFAFVKAGDPNHAAVREALNRWEGRLVTSNFVFDEVVTLVGARMGHSSAVRVGEALLNPEVADLIPVTPEDEESAWQAFTRHKDKGWSYTDCTSFTLMRRLRLPAAVTMSNSSGFAVVYPAAASSFFASATLCCR